MIDINWNPSSKELRIFALLETVFFGIVAFLLYESTGSVTAAMAVFGIAAAVGAMGAVRPPLIRPVYRAWMLAAFPVGWAVSHAVLAAVFYLVFTPIGLIMRVCGRNPMCPDIDRDARTYWIRRKRDHSPERYFRQF